MVIDKPIECELLGMLILHVQLVTEKITSS